MHNTETNGNIGNIQWKSYHVDSAEYNGKPLNVIKDRWEEFELGSIYLARIYAGSMYLALIQKYSYHTYGSVFIMGYGLSKPVYARLVNNVWTEQEQLISNSDLTARFMPIVINGYSGDTFKSVLKDKANNSVNFIVFASNTENPITDNPFSFTMGYAITFHAGTLNSPNILTILGISGSMQPIVEAKRLDIR